MKKETINLINQFRDERDWRQFHNPKDLAISISIETAELLELFQWKTNDEVVNMKNEALKEELADILIYSAMLAEDLGFDMDTIVLEKLKKNAEKYPLDKCRGNKSKYCIL